MKSIHRYVHGKGSRRDQHVGILLAVRTNDNVVITGAKVNLTAGDHFSPEKAQRIAWNRQSTVNEGRRNEVAASFKEDLVLFEDRCRRYFKDVTSFNVPTLIRTSIPKESYIKS